MASKFYPAFLFRRLLIKDKILVVYIPLIIFPLLVLGIMSSNLFTQSLIEKTKRNVMDESSLILSRIDSIIKNAESCANIATTDLNRIFGAYPAIRSPLEEYQFRNQIQSQLGIDLIIFPDVDSAVFIDNQQNIYTSYSSPSEGDKQIFSSGILEEIRSSGSYGGNHWLPMQLRDYLVTDPSKPVLTLGKVIIDIHTGMPLGSLLLNVKESSLSAVYTNMGQGKLKDYFLLDSRGMIVSAPDTARLLKPPGEDSLNRLIVSNESFSRIIRTNRGDDLITTISYNKMDWSLVNVVPMEQLTGDIRKNIWMTVYIGVICLLFALLGARVLTRVIGKPLLDLTKAMRKVKEGDLDVSCKISTPDEIGLLSSVFNTMISRIKELLVRVETDQRMKKEYELALIHAQIKPHFLYNTLDLIYVLNDMNRNEEARDTTKALADYYRVALSKGREFITIGEEMKNALDYLSIQRVRYSDIFDFEINVPSELMNDEIPKLSIQPIVENAIYHGLKTKGSFGHITINGVREGQHIVIRVKDDGIGMDEEKVKEIMGFRSREKKPVSFGIYSVHERIKLYFGEEFGVSIQSAAGKGTEVRITVPAGDSRGKEYV